ncbi:hypothetical protein J6590_071503 [Homalodisca vitripennis]|nr:hypothetical protein J6590_071503 [Homalodisca vitripennis]
MGETVGRDKNPDRLIQTADENSADSAIMYQLSRAKTGLRRAAGWSDRLAGYLSFPTLEEQTARPRASRQHGFPALDEPAARPRADRQHGFPALEEPAARPRADRQHGFPALEEPAARLSTTEGSRPAYTKDLH